MPLEEIHHSQRLPLLGTSPPGPDTDTETDESPPTTMRKAPQNKHLLGVDNKKYGHRKQLSLYSWLSNTPATSPNTAARTAATDGARPTKLTIQSPLGKAPLLCFFDRKCRHLCICLQFLCTLPPHKN